MQFVFDEGYISLGRSRSVALRCSGGEGPSCDLRRERAALTRRGPSRSLLAPDMAFQDALARLEVPEDTSRYATKIWSACQSAINDSTHSMQASTSLG